MMNNKLDTRRKKDSYEIVRNGELVFYFRKDIFPRWLTNLAWATTGTAVTALISYLIKIFVG